MAFLPPRRITCVDHYKNFVTWCQKWDSCSTMASICKPPESLSFIGDVAQNWKEFEEQLIWFLEGMESFEKLRIGIMLSHAGKEARDVYKMLPWDADGDNKKFDKVLAAFRKYCSPRKHILYE